MAPELFHGRFFSQPMHTCISRSTLFKASIRIAGIPGEVFEEDDI